MTTVAVQGTTIGAAVAGEAGRPCQVRTSSVVHQTQAERIPPEPRRERVL